MQKSIFITSLGWLLGVSLQAAPPTNLTPTPPMGWNSWNWHGKQAINEKIVQETIDAMVAQGLRDAGYTYVVVDGGWRDTKLGPKGELLSHPVKFPHGMKRLADYAHARGMKFGLHTVPGTHDCGGDPVGGFGHEEVQVKQFVDWGIDFIKLDKCRFEPGWDEAKVKAVYSKWSEMLARCGRDIVFSISAYAFRDWYPDVCQMARTTRDIKCRIHEEGAVFDDGKTADELLEIDAVARDGYEAAGARAAAGEFLSVMTVAELNNRSATFAGNGYWNDPDMMVTGKQGLTQEEQKAHFALWCVMSAPLMLGDDPRVITQAEKDIILNPECIAINQDPTEQGRRIKSEGDTEVWLKKLRNDRIAVLLLNRNATTSKSITFNQSDGAPGGQWKARDAFDKRDLGVFDGSISKVTPPHACWLLVISNQ